MFYTYILENPKKRLYIGHTNNTAHRLMQHNTGAVKSTKGKGPWTIVFTKKFNSKRGAQTYEKYLKSLKSQKYIREKIIGV